MNRVLSDRPYDSDLFDATFLEDIRTQMLKFAQLHLNDVDSAEDAVQEALIGALRNAGSFGRKAALKTWVFAILKNKITDVLRQQQRAPELLKDEADDLDHLFDHRGHWQKAASPAGWTRPMEAIKDEQFWQVFDACLNGLPAEQAKLFMMREFLELTSEEICQSLSLSVSNLHVMLHRARLKLRACLEGCWFLEGETRC